MINMLRTIIEKIDNTQEQIDNVIKKVDNTQEQMDNVTKNNFKNPTNQKRCNRNEENL